MSDPAEHFERLYRTSNDPWDYETSPYEAAKYAATLAALTRDRYDCAIEAGCSIGVLSARLAPRCDRLLAVDLVGRAAARAAARLAPHPGARAVRATLPGQWPRGRFDLIVLSELVYYLGAPDIEALARCVAQGAAPRAECVLVHYQGETDTEIRPDAARDRFCAVLADLRAVRIIDHPATADYNHRTLVIGP